MGQLSWKSGLIDTKDTLCRILKNKAKDPIEIVKKHILEEKWQNEEWFEEVAVKVKSKVDEAVKFAEESPYPEASELFNDVYAEPNYPFVKD
jgi:pyruvate dehydrogenase E1 component alpha subunit